jgi:hypothetical protein
MACSSSSDILYSYSNSSNFKLYTEKSKASSKSSPIRVVPVSVDSSSTQELYLTPSMVANWIPITYSSSHQSPSSLSSMVTHCALLPSPGDSFLSMEEVLEEMKKYFKDFWEKY